jgi:hypothetical protein
MGRALTDPVAVKFSVTGSINPQAAALDLADRRLTATILAHAKADVACLQEVFDLESLDAGACPWESGHCRERH